LSDRACYIQRTDRGARIVRARLLSERSDESWMAPRAGVQDAEGAAGAAVDAAEWVRDRLAETRSAKRLDTLCLDVDGAACSWVRGRDADADLIRSAVEGAEATALASEEEALDPVQTPGVADRLPRLPLEVSYDLLADEGAEAEDRTAVLAAPDAPARLLLDRLDALGVRVERVVTLWHALAEAWDPGARPSGTQSADIIPAAHPPAAVVAIDHAGGRLVWSWSRGGRLAACGSMRLKHRRGEPSALLDAGAEPAEVHEHDVARLASEWLGWASQIGVCPGRVVVVGRPGGGGMSSGEIGTALTRAWPGSITDLVGCDDAVAETLRRTLDARHLNAFAPLTERPTRAHRSAFRWAAAALLLLSACVGVLAALLFARAGQTRSMADGLRREKTEILTALDPALVMDPFPLRTLESQIGAIQRRTGRLPDENPRPVLDELATITMVLAMPGVRLDEVDVGETVVSVRTQVADVVLAERLDQALRGIGGSQLSWNTPSIRPGANGQVNAIYTAMWPQPRRNP
jgi:hypothetical protein